MEKENPKCEGGGEYVVEYAQDECTWQAGGFQSKVDVQADEKDDYHQPRLINKGKGANLMGTFLANPDVGVVQLSAEEEQEAGEGLELKVTAMFMESGKGGRMVSTRSMSTSSSLKTVLPFMMLATCQS
jgi:hypothetical protein